MDEETKCDVCQKPASQKCGGCHNVFYCSRDHQKTAWKMHKKVCRPYKVCIDSTLGRHLVATKDIPPGKEILREAPLIWGPAQFTVPVCLGCGCAIDESSRPCSTCGWPVCSETCEKAPAHIPECRYTVLRGDKVSIKNIGVIHPTYQCITVLRCLYQKQFLPEVWKRIDTLQSHCEERKNTAKYENERTTIAQFILRFFKLKNVFTEDEILRVCGIVVVNGHEVPLTEPPHVAIYESCSMFEHSCAANCAKTFGNQGEIVFITGSAIKKGDHLTICYTDPLWGTPNRRHYLYESKFFWCSCIRCSDPTEFNTYFSAIKCQETECIGYLLPKTFLENIRNGKTLDWTCNKCNNSQSAYSVFDILEKIGKDLSEMKKGVSCACKEFIRTNEKYLHSNHYYLTDVRYHLAQIIGQENEDGLPAVSDEDLKLKARCCQDVANLVKMLMPGERRVRGLLLFELHAALAEIGRREAALMGNPAIMHRSLLESKTVLEESADLLRFEPDVLIEGKIHKQALINLKNIDSVIRAVHESVGDSPI